MANTFELDDVSPVVRRSRGLAMTFKDDCTVAERGDGATYRFCKASSGAISDVSTEDSDSDLLDRVDSAATIRASEGRRVQFVDEALGVPLAEILEIPSHAEETSDDARVAAASTSAQSASITITNRLWFVPLDRFDSDEEERDPDTPVRASADVEVHDGTGDGAGSRNLPRRALHMGKRSDARPLRIRIRIPMVHK